MTNMCQLSFVVLVICALVHVGSGLKCFQCDELIVDPATRSVRENKNCGDPFNNATINIQVCAEGQACLKQKTPDLGEISPKSSRACGGKEVCKQLEENAKSLKIVCTMCTTDLCNSAPATSATFILGALFLFMKLLI